MEQHEDHHTLSLYNGQFFRKSHPPFKNFFEGERNGAGEGLHTPLTCHRTLTRSKEGVVSKKFVFCDERVAGKEVCVKWGVGKGEFSRSSEGLFPPLLLLPQLAGAKTELIFLKLKYFFGFPRPYLSGMVHEDHHSLSLYNGQIFRKSQPPLKNFLKKKETGRWIKAFDEVFRL